MAKNEAVIDTALNLVDDIKTLLSDFNNLSDDDIHVLLDGCDALKMRITAAQALKEIP